MNTKELNSYKNKPSDIVIVNNDFAFYFHRSSIATNFVDNNFLYDKAYRVIRLEDGKIIKDDYGLPLKSEHYETASLKTTLSSIHWRVNHDTLDIAARCAISDLIEEEIPELKSLRQI